MKYIVHNHEYNTESVLDQRQIEEAFPELKSGKLEIVDEIEDNYLEYITIKLSIENASALNESISNLWQLIAEAESGMGMEDLIVELKSNTHIIDKIINKCVES